MSDGWVENREDLDLCQTSGRRKNEKNPAYCNSVLRFILERGICLKWHSEVITGFYYRYRAVLKLRHSFRGLVSHLHNCKTLSDQNVCSRPKNQEFKNIIFLLASEPLGYVWFAFLGVSQ